MSLHLDILNTFSVHPASPVLLTSKGPQKTQAIRPHTPRGHSRRGERERGQEHQSRKSKGWSVFNCTASDKFQRGTPIAEVPAILPYDVRSLKIG